MTILPDATREPLWRAAALIAGVVVAIQVLVDPVLALLAAFGFTMSQDQRDAIVRVVTAFSAVLAPLGVAKATHSSTTPVKDPTLPSGTTVKVENSEETIEVP